MDVLVLEYCKFDVRFMVVHFELSLLAEHVKEPTIAANFLNGGTIDQFSKIELTCETLGSKIFYTTDGSPPELHMESAKVKKKKIQR